MADIHPLRLHRPGCRAHGVGYLAGVEAEMTSDQRWLALWIAAIQVTHFRKNLAYCTGEIVKGIIYERRILRATEHLLAAAKRLEEAKTRC